MVLACTPHCAFALQYMPIQRGAKNVALSPGLGCRTPQRSYNSFQRSKSHQMRASALAMSDATDLFVEAVLLFFFAPIVLTIVFTFAILKGPAIIAWISNRLMSDDDKEAAKLFQYQEICRGDGVIPEIGSIAVIFFEARLHWRTGSMLASTSESPPFAFEVGDSTIWRGLDAAVRKMREGATGHLMLTSEGGYTRCCMQPEPSDPDMVEYAIEEVSQTKLLYPEKDLFDPPMMHVRVRLEAVLELPPAMMAEGEVVPPHRLRKMLLKTSDGRYIIKPGNAE